MQERRFKIIYVSSNQVLSLFGEHCFFKEEGFWTVVSWRIKDLPKDLNVVAVNYDYNYAAWAFTIYSKEFPITPMGEPLPIIEKENIQLIKEEGEYVKKEPYTPFF